MNLARIYHYRGPILLICLFSILAAVQLYRGCTARYEREEYQAVNPARLSFRRIRTIDRVRRIKKEIGSLLIKTEHGWFQVHERDLFCGRPAGLFEIDGSGIAGERDGEIIAGTQKYTVSGSDLYLMYENGRKTALNTAGFPVKCAAAYGDILYYGCTGGGLRTISNIYSQVPGSPEIINDLTVYKGRLLIGSEDGLSWFDGKTVHRIAFRGPIHNNISALTVSDGILYAGTFQNGLSSFDGSWKHYQNQSNHKANWINALTAHQGKLWVASDMGVYSMKGMDGEITEYSYTDGHVSSVTVIGKEIAATRKNKVYFFNEENQEAYTLTNSSLITVAGNRDELWAGGSTGFYQLKDGALDVLSPITDKSFARWIQAIVMTGSCMYVGSYDRGIAQYNNKKEWEMIDHSAWVNPNAMLYAEDLLFVGTMETGLWVWDGLSWFRYTTEDGLAGDDVTALAFDGRDLWIGTRSGLSICSLKRIKTPGTPGGSENENLYVNGF